MSISASRRGRGALLPRFLRERAPVRYISELIAIEEKARRLIVDAVEHEASVADYEEQLGTLSALDPSVEAQRRLVGSIGRLNSVANVRRKGRDDLKVEAPGERAAGEGPPSESGGWRGQ